MEGNPLQSSGVAWKREGAGSGWKIDSHRLRWEWILDAAEELGVEVTEACEKKEGATTVNGAGRGEARSRYRRETGFVGMTPSRSYFPRFSSFVCIRTSVASEFSAK